MKYLYRLFHIANINHDGLFMKLLLKLPEDTRKKDVNMRLQRWENEGGNRNQPSDTVDPTPGLLAAGQKLEVLSTRIVEQNDGLYQEITIKPLTTKESSV